jgi:hypothetical protein
MFENTKEVRNRTYLMKMSMLLNKLYYSFRGYRLIGLWCLTHIMLYRVHLTWAVFELTTLVMIGTDCIGSCK